MCKCPKCGARIIVACLTSNPPHYEAECSHLCGYNMRFFQRDNSHSLITQEEINNHYLSDKYEEIIYKN